MTAWPGLLRWLPVLLVATVPCSGLEITVQRLGPACDEGYLVLEGVGESIGSRWDLQSIQTVTVPPALEASWILRVDSECVGSSLEGATLSSDQLHLDVLLWPKGQVTFREPAGSTLDAVTAVRFEEALPPGAERRIDPARSPCSRAEGVWTCGVPAVTLDLRIERDGAAPVYRWALDVRPDQPVDLGILEMVPGASVHGWVETATGDPSGVELRLEAISATGWSGDPSKQRRAEFRRLETQSDPKGFFQLTGVAPGSYRLTAAKPGLASTLVEPLVVERHEAVSAGPSIFLDRPLRLTVRLTPTRDPRGRPWAARLLRYSSVSNRLERVAGSEAVDEGIWRVEELTHGLHRLEIRSNDGASWLVRRISIDHGSDVEEFVDIPMFPIEGELTIGDEPISATISFGTTQKKPEIRIQANEEGYFEGFLPRDGAWPVEILAGHDEMLSQRLGDVEIEARRDSRPIWLDLRLPNTLVQGSVVRPNGEPVAEAEVIGLRHGSDAKPTRELVWRADKDGRFVARGLEPGDLRLLARHGGDQSPWSTVHLAEDTEGTEVVLVLRRFVEIEGYVHRQGTPVGGVTVLVRPVVDAASSSPLTRPVTTAADGTFQAMVPAESRALDFLLTAPGTLVAMRRTAGASSTSPRLLELGEGTGMLRLRKGFDALWLTHNDATWPFHEIRDFLFGLGKLSWDDDGTLAIRDMEAGSYLACGADALCDEGYLAPAGELILAASPDPEE